MSLKDLIQPGPTNSAGTWIPITQTVEHDEERSEGQSEKMQREKKRLDTKYNYINLFK